MFKSLSIIFFLLSMLNIYSQNLTINDGGKMIVGEAVNVTIEGNLVLNNSEPVEIKNSSFIVKGTSSGTGKIKYTKTVPVGAYQYISSPVDGQTLSDFVNNTSIETGKNSSSHNKGLYYYDYSYDKWVKYSTVNTNKFDKFKSGQGWIVRLKDNSDGEDDICFKGSFPEDNITIDSYKDTQVFHSGFLYDYIGNPYTSSIAVFKEDDNSATFFEKNSDLLEEETLWIWDESLSLYSPTNKASLTSLDDEDFYIEPAQGFFIKPKKNVDGSLSFNYNMQRREIKSSDQEKSSSSRPEIKLMFTDGSSNKYTNIFYIEGTTTGFDNGYDSTIFDNGGDDFGIYTHLVSDSQGDDYGIQSLPNSDYETMVVPVGFNATSSIQIIISAAIVNFPAGISVYLEDKEDSSFTLLDNSATYTTTLSEDINGIGRLYLHTTSSVLSTDKVALNNHLSIYTSSKENIRISGVYNGVAKLRMYNILGKQVLNTSFEGNGLNDIALPKNISAGVYIVHLTTESKIVTKKIMI